MGQPPARRNQIFLDLINEALEPDIPRYPELHFPVEFFRSDAAARHGDVLLNPEGGRTGGIGLIAHTRPADNALTTPPRIFIVMTPAALDHGEGMVSVQRALNNEYGHFQQKMNRVLMVRPYCRGAVRRQSIGGNPNREVLAIRATFTRFFPTWADAVDPATTLFASYFIGDLRLLKAHFPCVEPEIRATVIGTLTAPIRHKPDRKRLLRRMAEAVRERDLPNVNRRGEDYAMEVLARALGEPFGPDPRLPSGPERPRFGPLFDIGEFAVRSHERISARITEL